MPSTNPALSDQSLKLLCELGGFNSHSVGLVGSQTEQVYLARQWTQSGIKVGRHWPFHIPNQPDHISCLSS